MKMGTLEVPILPASFEYFLRLTVHFLKNRILLTSAIQCCILSRSSAREQNWKYFFFLVLNLHSFHSVEYFLFCCIKKKGSFHYLPSLYHLFWFLYHISSYSFCSEIKRLSIFHLFSDYSCSMTPIILVFPFNNLFISSIPFWSYSARINIQFY